MNGIGVFKKKKSFTRHIEDFLLIFGMPPGISSIPPKELEQVVMDFFFFFFLEDSNNLIIFLRYRKPDKTEEDEALDPCPFCSYPVRQTELDCSDCKQHLPYCVVTVSRV